MVERNQFKSAAQGIPLPPESIEMIEEYIAEQEGEPVQDESQFVIDEDTKLPSSRR
jgi:hypothetical protein